MRVKARSTRGRGQYCGVLTYTGRQNQIKTRSKTMHPAAVEALDHVLGGEKPANLGTHVLGF